MKAPLLSENYWEPANKNTPRAATLLTKRGKISLGASGKIILNEKNRLPPVFFWGDPDPRFKDSHEEIDEEYSIAINGPSSSGIENANSWSLGGSSLVETSEETGAFHSFHVSFFQTLDSGYVDAHPFTASSGAWVKTITAEKAWQLTEDALSLARANGASSSGTFDPPDFAEAEAFEDASHRLYGNEYGFDLSASDKESFWGTARFPYSSDEIKVEGGVSVNKYYYAQIFGVLGKNGAETKLLLDADFTFKEADITGPFKFKLALFKVKDSYDNAEFMSYDDEDMRLPAGQWEDVTPSEWTEFDSELFEAGEDEETFSLSIKDIPFTIVANKVYAMRIVITSKTEVKGRDEPEVDYISDDGLIYHDQSYTYSLESYILADAALAAGITLRAATS